MVSTLQQIHSNERDYLSACGLLGVGADYAHISGAQYSRLLFTLSKCMVLPVTATITFNDLFLNGTYSIHLVVAD